MSGGRDEDRCNHFIVQPENGEAKERNGVIGSENPILDYIYAEKFVERFEVAGAQMILVGINRAVETRQAKGGTRRVQAKGTAAGALEARFMPQE